jgi:hypothetical protein
MKNDTSLAPPQTPNSKLQTPEKLQTPSSKKRASSIVLRVAFGSLHQSKGECFEFVVSAVPLGLKAYTKHLPNVETLGYYRPSLRDENGFKR